MPGRSPSLALAIVALVWAGLASAALGGAPAGAAGSSARELRPDLVQRIPSNVGVRASGGRFALGFDSTVENHGDGPLRVSGDRLGAQPDMSADQLVRRADGTRALVKCAGLLRYTRSRGHHHWHLLRFDRYELRRASDHVLLRPDGKTGFCLGDRYDTGREFPAKPARAVITTNCNLWQPQARSVDMGISVGYGDDYRAYLEGQSIDITGLPAGRYELVHRVNGARRLRETSYSNNAAAVLLRVRWPGGRGASPDVDILKRCPGRERCVL
jgi:Lysyl oxidase